MTDSLNLRQGNAQSTQPHARPRAGQSVVASVPAAAAGSAEIATPLPTPVDHTPMAASPPAATGLDSGLESPDPLAMARRAVARSRCGKAAAGRVPAAKPAKGSAATLRKTSPAQKAADKGAISDDHDSIQTTLKDKTMEHDPILRGARGEAGVAPPGMMAADADSPDAGARAELGQDVATPELADGRPAGAGKVTGPLASDRAGSIAGHIRPGTTRVDLLEAWGDERDDGGEALQSVRIGANEVALVPFTSETEMVRLHYCEEPEIQGYVHCNGPGCSLCCAGRAADERALLPVYQPAVQAVGVLAISTSSRPGALRPQVLPALRSGTRVALLVRKPDRTTFKVDAVPLKEGMDDGARTIATFLRRWQAGEVDLAAVFPRLDDRDLAAIPGIGAMLKIKGLSLDGPDQR